MLCDSLYPLDSLSLPEVSITRLRYSFKCHSATVLYKSYRLAISFLHIRDGSRSKSYLHISSHFSKGRFLCHSFYHSCTRLHRNLRLSSAKHPCHVSFLIRTGLDNLSHFTNSTNHSLQDSQPHIFQHKYLHLRTTKVLHLVFHHLLQVLQ